MGKYTQVLRGLPSYKGEDASFFEKVVAKRLTLGVLSATQAAAGYAAARTKKDMIDEELSKHSVELAAWESAMHDAFESEGVSSVKLSTGESISTFPEPYAQVANPSAFREWCLGQEGLSDRMTLAWATTNSIAKERLLAGEEPPPGIEIYVKTKSRLSRG
jgi:hypothetical protein